MTPEDALRNIRKATRNLRRASLDLDEAIRIHKAISNPSKFSVIKNDGHVETAPGYHDPDLRLIKGEKHGQES